MSDHQGDEQGPYSAPAGEVESVSGPAASDGPGDVDVSGADLDVEGGPRQESGSALDADQFEGGAAESGGTGGANAGGAG